MPPQNFAASARRWNANTAPSKKSLRKSLRGLTEVGSTQEDLITIRGDRFVIPVKARVQTQVPGVIHGSSSSGQTVFVEPLETIEQNNELVRLLDEEQSEIHRILVAMTHALGENATAIHLGTCIPSPKSNLTLPAPVSPSLSTAFARASHTNCLSPLPAILYSKSACAPQRCKQAMKPKPQFR